LPEVAEMNGNTKHNIFGLCIVLALLGAFMGCASAATVYGASLNTSDHYLAESNITFIGTAIEYFEEPGFGAPYGWNVSVDEVISGSTPCNWLNVTIYATFPAGSMDKNITAGDKVEVYGNYSDDPEGCSVSLVGSENYYIARAESNITFIGTAIEYFEEPGFGAPYGWNVSVDEVLSGSTPCNWLNVTIQTVAPPFGSMDQNITAGDKVEVYGNYSDDPGCSVSLVGSEDYYIVRLGVHNINTSEDFVEIQDAIYAPSTVDGHTIVVDAGTYYEDVVVNKSLTLQGEGLPTIDAQDLL
jgi:hypothetical protein